MVLAIMLFGLVASLGASPGGNDNGVPDPGALPPGLGVKVFIHYPKVVASPASTCATPGASTCDAYGQSTTSGGLPIRWEDPTGGGTGIPYYVDPGFSTRKSPGLTQAAAVSAIDAGFAAWEAASDAGLNYTNKGAIKKVAANKLDGRNVIQWRGLNSTAIAVTYVWYYTSTGYIAEVGMIFNNNYSWAYTEPTGIDPLILYDDPDNSGVAGRFDVRNIATHEAGHTIMLDDLYDPSTADLTMHGYGAYAELKKDTLGYGDVLGVQAAY